MVAIATILLLPGCSKDNSPVDQYVKLLDQASDKAEKISSIGDLVNVQEIISPENANEIIRQNKDYKLSDSDKEKLKKSYERLLRIAYKKTIEYGGLEEASRKQMENQIDLFLDGAKASIDKAHTLGDLGF